MDDMSTKLDMLDISPPITWNKLVEDKHLSMNYRVTAVPGDATEVLLTLELSNRNSALIKSMVFNVVDSPRARLLRGSHEQDGVELPHQIPPRAKIEISLVVAVDDSTCSHYLRGILTYMAQMESGSVSEKMDFKLKVPCSIFLINTSISCEDFTELVLSQDMTAKAEITCKAVSLSWALNCVQKELNFCLVEMDTAGCSASLYGQHSLNHHLCLLIKTLTGGRISICGKSSNQSLVTSVMEELQQIFQ